jgi:hypothetical protein
VRKHFSDVLVDRGPYDVHLSFSPVDPCGRLLHKVKYRKRSPTTDLAEFFTLSSYDVPDKLMPFIVALLNYRNVSRSFGWWSRLSRFAVIISANREGQACPLCGRLCMTDIVGFDEVRRSQILYVDRRGDFWRLVEPGSGARLRPRASLGSRSPDVVDLGPVFDPSG